MDKEKRKYTPLEIVIASLGFIIVIYILSFTIYEALSDDKVPPSIQIKHEKITKVESGYLVSLLIINLGDETAQNLIIEGNLKSGENEIEKSIFTLDYLPSHSSKEAGIYFQKNPSFYKLTITPIGYQKP